MNRKRIRCLSNASQHVPIYLQPFLRYSKLLVENCDIFTPQLCLAAQQGVTPSEFREDLDTHKTRMNGLSCGEESMTIYSAVLIQYQRVTDGRTDVQPISITCFSIADARKKRRRKWIRPTPCSRSIWRWLVSCWQEINYVMMSWLHRWRRWRRT